jgi:NAD+ synthase
MSQKYRRIKEYLIQFLKEETFKTGLNGGVLLLDGSVESIVVAILAKEAFGNRLLTLVKDTDEVQESVSDILKSFCMQKDIRYMSVSANAVAGAYPLLKEADEKRKKAFISRVEMAILYDMASYERALVLGAKSKSALLLGVGTSHGDLACALNPVGDLYESEIVEFSKFLGADEVFPSGESVKYGVDEEIGLYSVEALDSALKAFTEERLSRDELLAKGYDSEMVEMIIRRIYQNQFKHNPPIVAKLTSRTVGHDLQYPRDIKL